METRTRAQEEEGVHSEYGGLVLSADSALGVLGVHEPCGATLGLRIRFLFHEVPLGKKQKQNRHGTTSLTKLVNLVSVFKEDTLPVEH